MVIKTLISLATGILIRDMVDHPRRGFSRFSGVSWPFCSTMYPMSALLSPLFPQFFLPLSNLGKSCRSRGTAGYMVVDFILGNVIEPRLMGRKLGLSTLVVFLSLVFWGSLLGPVGMVLCIPLTMTLKFACENNKSTQWIAVLLSSELATEQGPPGVKK